MSLAERCYLLSRGFPKEEMFGLTSQIRRAAVSIPSIVAEGHGRESTQSFVQYLRMAQGSLKEIETQIVLAVRVGIASQEDVAQLLADCESLGKMIRQLIRSLQTKVRNEK